MGWKLARFRRVITVRQRITAAMVAVALFGLTISGATAYYLQNREIDQRVDENLSHLISTVSGLSERAINPVNGEPLESADDVISAAIQLISPGTHQSLLGIRSAGGLLQSQQQQHMELHADAEFVAEARRIAEQGHTALVTINTDLRQYRVLVLPVFQAADPDADPSSGTDTDTGHATLIVAADRSGTHADFNTVFASYALVALAATVLVGLLAWVVAGRLLRPIRVLAQTATSITESDLSRRIPVRTNDDLGTMTDSVNSMLGRLDAAFAANRQLLDDVSHELRTPITVVRGHLELMDPQDPADVAETKNLALDELDRMNLLVADLLTLATADSPDFAHLDPMDGSELLAEVFAKAKGLGERDWQLAVRGTAPILADRNRLTQALMQLAANAVKYSSPDSTIELGVQPVGDRLELWVRDEGIGIPADQQPHIFKRFERGSAEAKQREGAGLGLAIVQAIADHHRAEVRLNSAPGAGSTFTITLPIEPITADQDVP